MVNEHFGHTRATTDDLWSIDIRAWQRDGKLARRNAFTNNLLRQGRLEAKLIIQPSANCLTVRYQRYSGDYRTLCNSVTIRIVRTPCHFGGNRPWFLCPKSSCHRRTAKLYIAAEIACRECQQLGYSSQRETALERSQRKAERIRRQLGWQPGILRGRGSKPRGMHWRTFYRLTNQYDVLVQELMRHTARQFDCDSDKLA